MSANALESLKLIYGSLKNDEKQKERDKKITDCVIKET